MDKDQMKVMCAAISSGKSLQEAVQMAKEFSNDGSTWSSWLVFQNAFIEALGDQAATADGALDAIQELQQQIYDMQKPPMYLTPIPWEESTPTDLLRIAANMGMFRSHKMDTPEIRDLKTRVHSLLAQA